jgi:hypothetical protein
MKREDMIDIYECKCCFDFFDCKTDQRIGLLNGKHFLINDDSMECLECQKLNSGT